MPIPGPIPYPVSGETITTGWGTAVADAVNARTPQGVRLAATQAITNAEADLVGVTLTVGPGTFVVMGVFDIDVSVGIGGLVVAGRLSVDGVTQAPEAQLFFGTATGRASVSMIWYLTIAGAGVLKARVFKYVAGGTSQALLLNTGLVVI